MKKLPKSWVDITLSQIADIHNIQLDQSIGKDSPQIESIEMAYHIISLLTEIPFNQLEEMKLIEIKAMMKQLDFLNSPPPDKGINFFKIGKIKFKINRDIKEIKGGDYINLSEWCKDDSRIMYNASKIMSTFCTPFKWNWLKMKWVKIKMKDDEKWHLVSKCPATVAYPLTLFFCNLLTNLTNHIVDYSEKQLVQTAEELKYRAEALMKNGTGI